jgi:hypothetical protein
MIISIEEIFKVEISGENSFSLGLYLITKNVSTLKYTNIFFSFSSIRLIVITVKNYIGAQILFDWIGRR